MSDPSQAAGGSGPHRPASARGWKGRSGAAFQGWPEPSRPSLGRRFLLAAAAGLAVRPAVAAGPVFMDLTQSALDDAYTQSVWAPDAPAIIAGYGRDSAAVRAAMPPRTERYGPGQTLDLFIPHGATSAPVMAFLHGGAWRALGKEDVSAPAPTFTGAGCIYAGLGFDNIPAATLPGMADQVRRAVLWLAANVARFGGDPAQLFVAGHSSGAHLCAVLLTTDWTALGQPPDLLKGGACLSGMYELHPVLLSARSSYVRLAPAEVDALSPLRHMGRVACPVLVGSGGRESPEFKRQADTFAAVLAGMGRLHGRAVMPDLNHFQVPNQLNDAGTPLSRAVLGMMRPARAGGG